MRNLKKILALVLALVMSFSLMATANAFTDDEKITDTYETAVTVLDGLKVFQGYEDGSFRPQDAIKRSEVAAIIYRIVTGDVAGTQVGIYADYNKFTDVKSTSWYAGYVNFCANAEYIKGRDAKTFDPDAYVTGYEALAMILRAIGYDKNGEFTGSNWQVQTAATGEQRGITKNISEGTLGTYASREVVAEILFQTILVDKVNYTPAFGYQLDDTSLGWDTFELEEIEGVVIANEYADLYATKPLKAGKTELDVDGDSYTLAYTTELTDIGEARLAYITKGENVLYIADAGNTVFETGAATDIEKDKDFEKATGLERDDDTTEQFINFSQDGKWTCDYLLTFSVFDANGDVVANDEHVVKANVALTDKEFDDLKASFNDNDGFVYLGTKNTEESEDYSNTMSWNKFRSEYLDNSFQDDVTESDNGEWLKVIDNDGDGVADYVLLTEFVMSFIERISKDNTYYLADLAADDAAAFTEEEIDGDEIITEDELAVGDVVIYTKIDGNYYMNIAEMVTETVDKKGIDKHDETMTCDGTVYTQSHIGYTEETYYSEVSEGHTEETYDLYLDHFGYVRLFIESDYNVFMLLTDGWYENDHRDETLKAYYWDVAADEETQIDVVNNNDADEFINTFWQAGDEETWRNLFGANWTYLHTYGPEYVTNIAGYTETDDGYSLKKVQNSTGRIDYEVQELNPADGDDALELDALELTGTTYAADGTATNSRVQTSTKTQYYLVIVDYSRSRGEYVEDVITWVGKNNAPEDAELVNAVAYAVTHESAAEGRRYDVADVVVFESDPYADRDTYFVYDVNNWSDIEYVYGIGYNDEGAVDDKNKLLVEDGAAVIRAHDMIQFYRIFDDETVEFIGENYAANDIYAGRNNTTWDLEPDDYIQVAGTAAGNLYIGLDAPIYKVSWDVDEDEFSVSEMNRDDVEYLDHLILFTDDSDDNIVEYAINVSASLYAAGPDTVKDDVVPAVANLWYDIWLDAENIDAPELELNDDKLSNAVAAATDPTAVRDALGRIVSWTVTVKVTANDGFVIDSKDDVAAVLADSSNGTITDDDKTLSADKKTLTITVSGLTKDNTLILTGNGALDAYAIATELADARDAYREDPTDQDLIDALKAAATKYYNNKAAVDAAIAGNQALMDEVDAAEVAALAECAAKEIADANYAGRLNTRRNVGTAYSTLQTAEKDTVDQALFAAYLGTLSAADAKAARDAFNANKTTINELMDLIDLGDRVIDGWATYNSATATPAEKQAAIEKAVAAHNTYVNMPAKDYPAVNSWTDSAADAVYTLMGGDGSAYNNAKNGVVSYINGLPVAPVVGLKLSNSALAGKWDSENNTLTVPEGANLRITADNKLALDVTGGTNYLVGVTGATVTIAAGEADDTYVATFTGLNGAKPVKVTITVVYLNDTAELEKANDTATFTIDNGNSGFSRKITGVGNGMTWEQLSQAIKLSEKSAGATITIVDTTSGVAPVAGAKATTVTVIVTTEYGNEYSYVVQA